MHRFGMRRTNPNLKPWAKEVMKRENDKVLAGGIGFTARSSCMPAGVPAFMMFAGVEPMYFLQTPKEVTMIFSGDAQVRHVYLDVPHSANPKPSWYGESVGHYEGNMLVIDTIGMNDKTYVDNFRTPHTQKLHVVERWKLVDDNTIDVNFTVDDDTFDKPWTANYGFRRVTRPMNYEEVCAENNLQFAYHVPVAPRAGLLSGGVRRSERFGLLGVVRRRDIIVPARRAGARPRKGTCDDGNPWLCAADRR
jgi:hypothetical protein